MPSRTRYGRLFVNTEIYPCAKRAYIALGAIHLSRVVGIQIIGQEQKKLTDVLYLETGKGEVGRFHGRIEQILDRSAKNAGLTKTQYK